ncbi:hypothetical protein Mapa_004209 [Marchantia paleacea]|nr:hypothetical protein Mapa_004209 [Marchantia paleacea]
MVKSRSNTNRDCEVCMRIIERRKINWADTRLNSTHWVELCLSPFYSHNCTVPACLLRLDRIIIIIMDRSGGPCTKPMGPA